MSERLRWKIVDLVDRLLPGQCWTDLVCWVLALPEDRTGLGRLPWEPIGEMCRRDFAAVGSCYCGAFRDPGPERLCGQLRTTCCAAPVVHDSVWQMDNMCWAFPLRCMGCGREAGCLFEVEREEAWAGRSRGDGAATGTPNQGGGS